MASVEAFRTFQLRDYHELFLNERTRTDGRHFEQFRDVLLSKNTITSADGSCMVKLGNTTFAAGISATIVKPSRDAPKNGIIKISAELPPLCINSQRFKTNRHGTNDESQALAERIRTVIVDSKCFRLEQLCIEESKAVWQLEIHTICLDFDGNYFDAALMSIVGALVVGSVPDVQFKTGHDDVNFLETTKKLTMDLYPISCSFAVFDNQIILADPNHEEEQLSTGSIHIIYDAGSSTILSVTKDGGTGLDDQHFQKLFESSIDRAKHIVNLMTGSSLKK